MSLQVMNPVYNELPFFQANQVLTVEHLNDLAGYLSQQEHYTRNKLIGSGIVCGMSFKWENHITNKARVIIDDGCAITSAGYTIIYKQPVQALDHRRNFQRLNLYPPFDDSSAAPALPIYELITQDEFDSENVLVKDFLYDTDKVNRVLILFLEPEVKSPAKCLDENCDDKGKVYLYTIRPLLVPVAVINALVDASNTKSFFTEEGRGAKGRESMLFNLDYIRLGNLFKNNNLQILDTTTKLVNLFKAPCTDTVLNAIKTEIDTLIIKFPWIFNVQFNCMKAEVTQLNVQTLGTLFKTKSQTFRNAPGNNNYIQYLYDFIRDIVDAYNELFSSVTDLVGECGGNEYIHPFHVMLGLPQTNDTLACYKEEKYNEHNFKYHNYFIPSPVLDSQFMLFEKTQSLFKRLVRIIANFNISISDTTIKVTPSKDYNSILGERALPYYYLNAAAHSMKRVWNYDATRRNKINRIKGYQLVGNTVNDQDYLLDEDTSKNDLYRIEGHIGIVAGTAKNAIDDLRKKYNLPFSVSTVSITEKTNALSCTFFDLEEEYNYYKDRVLGYITEIHRYTESLNASVGVHPEIVIFYGQILVAISKMKNELLNAKCIENFNYLEYKKAYNLIWEAIFEAYFLKAQSTYVNKANQRLNTVINIFNIVVFRPIYKIIYMYKYRMDVLEQSRKSSLPLLTAKTSGLEHLAGVRRGETFLLVSDINQGDKVVADFNVPDMSDCDCECNPKACDGTKRSLVSPLQKPIIMVVDYAGTGKKTYMKLKAFLDATTNQYALELDGMGFYKADSTITQNVVVKDSTGNIFSALNAKWENNQLILRYSKDNTLDGAFKLSYELTGNFEGSTVKGELFLFVIGRIKPGTGTHVTWTTGGRITKIYPYEKATLRKAKPEMNFEGVTKLRTIGAERVRVYTTANGNEMGIYTDSSGFSYIKVINAKNPGVDEVPFTLTSGGAATNGTVKINVIDKKDKLAADVIAGKVLTEDGLPLKDAKLTTSGGKEVLTNEKGEYSITGIKAGDVITVEKGGYKTNNIQANSNLNPEINLTKEPLFNIPGLEGFVLPGNLGNLAEVFNIETLRNFMK